eukprot:SM000012S25406  [mRNA]  locus=s12:981127:983279:+ [translate_table: standard]
MAMAAAAVAAAVSGSRARTCWWVDEVVPDAPWVIDEAFLARHRIDYVAHDALPYADASGSSDDVYAYVKKVGKFRETRRTEGVSTSDLIVRILRGYNEYVMRNLARGYTRKDLGVSYVKAQQLHLNLGIRKLQERVEQNRQSLGRNLNTVAERVGMNFQSDWVENADRWVTGFLELFEEGFHYMASAPKHAARENAIKTQIQPFIAPRASRRKPSSLRGSAGAGGSSGSTGIGKDQRGKWWAPKRKAGSSAGSGKGKQQQQQQEKQWWGLAAPRKPMSSAKTRSTSGAPKLPAVLGCKEAGDGEFHLSEED